MTLQLNFREKSLIWWKLHICNMTQHCMVALDLFANGSIYLKIILQFSSQTCVWSYLLWELSNIIPTLTASLIREAFSVSSGLIFPPLSLVHTGFSTVPHGSNDPLIILYSDALIKLMCWFYVFNLPWSPTIPSVPSGSAFTLKWGSAAALITVPR